MELCDSNLEEYLAKVKLEAFKNIITFLHQLGKRGREGEARIPSSEK